MSRLALAVLPLLLGGGMLLAAYGRWAPAPVMVLAAEQMRSGVFGPPVYDDRVVSSLTHDILSPSPPTLPLFLLPLLPLSPSSQSFAWTAGNLVALLLAAWLIVTRLPRLRRAPVVASLGLLAFVLSALVAVDVQRGQVYLWQLLFLSLPFAAGGSDATSRVRSVWLGAAGLALAFALKVAGWPLWLVLAVRGEWAMLRRAALIVVAGVLVTLPLIGVDTWVHYWIVLVPEWTVHAEGAVTAYQTVGGFFHHFLAYDAVWNPQPLVDIPMLAFVLALAAAIVLLGFTLRLARRGPRTEAIAAAVLLTALLSPVGEQYQYVPCLIALAPALEGWLRRPTLRQGMPLMAAAALLMLPLPFMNPALANGPIALLAYPRLLGALLLWAQLVFRAPAVAAPARPDRSATDVQFVLVR